MGCTIERSDPGKIGGYTDYYRAPNGTPVIVKNIARGRLRTGMCGDCDKRSMCGEGVYALRVGVNGSWKPCLLNQHKSFTPGTVDQRGIPTRTDLQNEILDAIHGMVG